MHSDVVIRPEAGDKPRGEFLNGGARLILADDPFAPWLLTRDPAYLRALAAVATELADALDPPTSEQGIPQWERELLEAQEQREAGKPATFDELTPDDVASKRVRIEGLGEFLPGDES